MDFWIGPTALANGSIIACEDTLTPDKQMPVYLTPNASMPVDTTPLWSPPDGCIVPEQPCEDVGVECGNECETPKAASCARLAESYFLSLARFEALNKVHLLYTPTLTLALGSPP
jgi:hypothetical protein